MTYLEVLHNIAMTAAVAFLTTIAIGAIGFIYYLYKNRKDFL